MMKTNQSTAAIILFSTIFMVGIPLSSYAGQIIEPRPVENIELVANPAETEINDMEIAEDSASNGKGAAKGCATGAAIGTALAPGVGTVAGCIIAGIWGWFW